MKPASENIPNVEDQEGAEMEMCTEEVIAVGVAADAMMEY